MQGEEFFDRWDLKVCGRCRKWKPLWAFGTSVTRRNGRRYEYKASRCKACKAELAREWSDKKRAEGTLAAHHRKWYENLVKQGMHSKAMVQRRAYARGWQQGRDGREPKEKSYAYMRGYETGRAGRSRVMVDVGPFARWLKEWQAVQGITPTELGHLLHAIGYGRSGKQATKKLWDVCEKQKRVDIEFVDIVLIAVGMPQMLTLLYPLNDQVLDDAA